MRLKSTLAAWLALAAMMAQVVFGFAHAMGAVASSDSASGAESGYMDICTAHGLVRVPASDLPPASSDTDEQSSPITKCPACFILKHANVSPPSGSIRIELPAGPLSWDIGADAPSLDLGPPSPLRSRAPPPRI